MTVREMQMAFDTRIQLVSEAEVIKTKPDSFTILQFLNRAQEKYITENYLSRGSLQDNIEFIQRRSGALRYIISRAQQTISSSAMPDGGLQIDLPADFLYYMKSYSKITNTLAEVTSFTWSPNRVINHNELDRVTNGVFNIPILREPCIVFEEETAILYIDKDTALESGGTDNYYMIYLRQPKTMVLSSPGSGEVTTCELDDFVHNDIVELAVQMYIIDYKYRLGASSVTEPQQTSK